MATIRPFERLNVMAFETKSFDVAAGVFIGLASTPQLDRMQEIVSAEAMSEAADRYMRNPVITWQHDTDEPIGKGLRAEVSAEGTLLEAYITDKTDCGRKVRGLLEDGIVRSLSIGFNPYSRSFGVPADGTPDYEMAGNVLTWRRIDWLETAVCAIPCNPGATIMLAKSLALEMPVPSEQSPEEREEERFLADMERVRTGAISVRNIAAHWCKEGRALSPCHLAALRDAQAELAALVPEPDPATAEDPIMGQEAAPCLLQLPQPVPPQTHPPVLRLP
jgi:HK97 family phage prohead protease